MKGVILCAINTEDISSLMENQRETEAMVPDRILPWLYRRHSS